jgi:hypothetical protein
MDPHIPEITNVIQLAVAALFVLAVTSLTVSLLLFLREIFLAVSTPRHVSK